MFNHEVNVVVGLHGWHPISQVILSGKKNIDNIIKLVASQAVPDQLTSTKLSGTCTLKPG